MDKFNDSILYTLVQIFGVTLWKIVINIDNIERTIEIKKQRPSIYINIKTSLKKHVLQIDLSARLHIK